MKNIKKKFANKRDELKYKRKLRIRDKITGSAERPRMSVFRSSNNVICQVIDDVVGKTLVSASSFESKNRLGHANKKVCFEKSKVNTFSSQ